VGEAKRRRRLLQAGPCRCLSSSPAGLCCYIGHRWHKAPASLGLRNLPKVTAVNKCYMSTLGSCDGAISGEHLISKSVIEFIKDNGEFAVSGVPWLEEGESKILSPRTLTANCLCSKHNSALSPLDTAALRFFQMLRPCWVNEAAPLRYLISGHDLERWLLKSLKALAVSGNLAKGRQRLPGLFQEDVRLIDMLDDPRQWPQLTGLYFIMRPGTRTENRNHFQLAPLYGLNNDVIAGLVANILGLSFLLMVEPPDIGKSPPLRTAIYRPGSIGITIGGITNQIDISWDDSLVHLPTSLTYAGPIIMPSE
jgi:hypothetical protein